MPAGVEIAGMAFVGSKTRMNWFDQSIIHFINSFARRSWAADATIVTISRNVFLVGGVLMVLFWWAWLEYGKEDAEKRDLLAANLGLTAFGVVVARALALSVPYRERPCHNPLLHFQLPYTADPGLLIHWSSFPSDHALVSFCLATGLWIVSRRLGFWALIYAALISFPRIYIGAHYPTDILAGAGLGVVIAYMSKLAPVRKTARVALDYLNRRPAYLYTLLFAVTFETGEMYESLRRMAVLAVKSAMRLSAPQVEQVAYPVLAALVCVLAWLVWRRRHSVA